MSKWHNLKGEKTRKNNTLLHLDHFTNEMNRLHLHARILYALLIESSYVCAVFPCPQMEGGWFFFGTLINNRQFKKIIQEISRIELSFCKGISWTN